MDEAERKENQSTAKASKYLNHLWNGLKGHLRDPKFFIEVLALIGLFFYTYETRRTNNLTKTSLTQSKQQFTDSQASAKSQFDQAQAASLKQFIGDQRPYLWRTDPDMAKHPEGGEPGPYFKIGKKVWWQLYYQNYGKTPAVGIRDMRQLEFGPNALQKLRRSKVSLGPVNGDRSGSSILAPGQIMFVTVQSKREATTQDYQFIVVDNNPGHQRYRENSVAVLVHFEYFDIYGTRYDSYLCEVC